MQEQILSEGQWSENISWQFIASPEIPDRNVCTGICCVTTFRNKLVLVRNRRGWEFPGGNIELEMEESIEDAVIRESAEEACAIITNPTFFGFKRLASLQPVPRPNNSDLFYPFPISYIAFFYADVIQFLNNSPQKDIDEVKIVDYLQAKKLLKDRGQYKNVLEYLIEQRAIKL